MSEETDKKDDIVSDDAEVVKPQAEDHLEDEEKIMAGRQDVNYPALLTKDVPGG